MNICISIGHGKSAKGGYDSGALGGNYQEFKIGREIGKYIGEIFKGYACTADVINYDATLYLTERIAHINKHGYDLAIEIHLNAAGGTGSEVYYKHKSATGKKLAAAISKSIANTFGIRDRGAKVKINPANGTDYFGFVRSCKCESLLIETVFIDTASDRKHVETAAGQKQCAEAIVSAIANFYGIKKKSAPAVKPSEDKPTTATVRAGDIVKIKGSKYATGQKIPMWVKLKKHTVKTVSGSRALLKEIRSWVYVSDLTVLQSSAKITVGSKVKIKSGATYGGLTAARGSIVPNTQLKRTHTVGKIQKNGGVQEALLTDIASWVAVKNLEVVG
jgi:N-acetylmuramoyl-L-alanine amidase|uniref:Cell wall hydrolase autolysin n=1 Tax=Myoviridae sp. ctKkB1 TaxID=2825081 RepID=A0A8S5V4A3_9CAUD|nr:MAG TPA: Cell wall hydrolase autolysin [Myoviridae sp. ctKkB1]